MALVVFIIQPHCAGAKLSLAIRTPAKPHCRLPVRVRQVTVIRHQSARALLVKVRPGPLLACTPARKRVDIHDTILRIAAGFSIGARHSIPAPSADPPFAPAAAPPEKYQNIDENPLRPLESSATRPMRANAAMPAVGTFRSLKIQSPTRTR